MKGFYLPLIFITALSCLQSEDKPILNPDIQGHRGCRGLMPENSIPAMIKALEIGVSTLEMDVVITMDKKVVLSHEPFLNPQICLDTNMEELIPDREEEYNIYTMNYEDLSRYDCGSKGHIRFSEQNNIKLNKPLLSDVIDTSEAYCISNNRDLPFYNIEIKSRKEWDLKFHPAVPEYCDLVIEIIMTKSISERTIIQSFDPRVLKYLHNSYPEMPLAYLLEDVNDWKYAVDNLGFKPDIISPYFPLLSTEIVKSIHKKGIKVIPWTVNEINDIEAILKMNVDGIISDYPDRCVKGFN